METLYVSLKVVAVVQTRGVWSAYAGPSEWTDERVAEEGTKLSRTFAEYLFPVFAPTCSYE